MNFEKEYYEFERFWKDHDYIWALNSEKIEITFDFIKSDVNDILDVGCGNGVFTNLAMKKFPDKRIVGFDRSETALKYVQAEKIRGEIDDIPFPDLSFDCVVAHDVIEHLPVNIYPRAIHEIARIAKKYIIIAVPNAENLEDNISQCPACKTTFNNNLHFRSFGKSDISNLFNKKGFSCLEIKTCDRNTFYIGQKTYGNLFYPKWKRYFRSPICPLCGYRNHNDQEEVESLIQNTQSLHRKSLLSQLKEIPKLIWPKYSKDYEMVALFQKCADTNIS
jgi:ubiquinone/menaquinone biosynthesis C-methylase UbiE